MPRLPSTLPAVPGVLTIPAYREGKRLPAFLAELLPALRALPFPIVLQIVDDGSPATEVHALRAVLPCGTTGSCTVAPLLALPRNTRKGGAILAGWRAHPDAAWYAFIDADGAVPAPEFVRLLLAAAPATTTSPALHVAVRDPRAALTVRRDPTRALAARAFTLLARLIAGPRLPDYQCGLKLLTAPAWRTLNADLLGHGLCFDVELVARAHRAGFPIHPFPIAWQERQGGSIHLPTAAPAMLLQLARLTFQLRRNSAPRSSMATLHLTRLAALAGLLAFTSHVTPLAAAEPTPATPPPPPAINPDGWTVHDPARPVPPLATPRPAEALAAASVPPAGAVILFGGTDLSAWQTPAWLVNDGTFEVTPKAGNLLTRESFGSCHLHLEWSAPLPVKGGGQGRGNSGVFLMDRYEIQILDNHDNPTYADGYAGSVYGQHPPLANAVRPPGEWNTYDIFFRAPRFSPEGKLLRTASVTVVLNGIVVQNNAEFYGTSGWKKVSTYSAHPPAAPLRLQDHGDRVRFRNIWIVPTPDLPAK